MSLAVRRPVTSDYRKEANTHRQSREDQEVASPRRIGPVLKRLRPLAPGPEAT